MKTQLRAVRFVFVRGLRGMRQSPLVQTVAVLTMSVCMLLVGLLSLALINAEGVIEGWGVDIPITVYLEEAADEEDAAGLAQHLDSLPEVVRATHVPPDEAMKRLQDGLGTEASVLEGVEVHMFPRSVEVELAETVTPAFADALARRLRKVRGVEEVAVLGVWAEAIESGVRTMTQIAVGLFLLVSVACVSIVWSTIRLAVFARRSEVEILRLVGGTRRFVRAPFVIEGGLQGALGAALAVTLLALSYQALLPHLEQGLSLLFAGGALRFFSAGEICFALALGAALGIVGARMAVARYVEV